MTSLTFPTRDRLPIVGLLALALFGSLSPLGATAQDAPARNSASLAERPWRMAVATGASFFWGAEGNTVGLLLESGLLRRVRKTPFSLRGDLMYHHYGKQSVAPCLVSANQTCFSLLQRAIMGGALGAQYTLKPLSQNSSATPYLLGGLATYISTRVATRPPACSPGAACPNVTAQYDLTDIDYGMQVGLGTTWSAGKREFYLESKYHHRFIRDHRSDPFTMFRFSPIAVGMRF